MLKSKENLVVSELTPMIPGARGITPEAMLARVLRAFRKFYNVRTEQVAPPFDAEADFHMTDEQYFLIKRAKISTAESGEHVFFAIRDHLDLSESRSLATQAWERGLARIHPDANHRSTDILLILAAEHIDRDAADYFQKLRRYRSYWFTLRGWSHYRVIAVETSTGKAFSNGQGEPLQRILRNIFL